MAYDNTNSGFIGKNQRKETDKHPDIKGSINVEGREYWVDGWKNAKGYGLRIKPKEARGSSARPAPAPAEEFPDDEIPF